MKYASQVSRFDLCRLIGVTGQPGAWYTFARGAQGADRDDNLEMEPGSAFVFLGTVYHGAGHNTVPDQVRKLYGLFFIPGTLRPEENQFLAVPRSKVLGMSEKMLSLLGYKKPDTWLGIVNNGDPAENLVEVLNMANA